MKLTEFKNLLKKQYGAKVHNGNTASELGRYPDHYESALTYVEDNNERLDALFGVCIRHASIDVESSNLA